jgi:Domain of unknown function (DUF5679)
MSDEPIGYCVKCKQKREMKNTERVTLKSHRIADKGVCTVCGTTMFHLVGSQKKEVKA